MLPYPTFDAHQVCLHLYIVFGTACWIRRLGMKRRPQKSVYTKGGCSFLRSTQRLWRVLGTAVTFALMLAPANVSIMQLPMETSPFLLGDDS